MNRHISAAILATIRPIPDHPSAGIVFQDITPVLADAALLRQVIEEMAGPFMRARVTHIVGIEARGFILGAPVAAWMGVGFIPARKPGKLPWKTMREDYTLEYGTDALEAHQDALPGRARVLVVDDVLATGGTARAAGALVHRLGGELVGWSFLLQIAALRGRRQLAGAPVHVLASR